MNHSTYKSRFRPKHRILKRYGTWYLVRRSFGFSPWVNVSKHKTQQEAIHAADSKAAGTSIDSIRSYTPDQTTHGRWRLNNFPVRIY